MPAAHIPRRIVLFLDGTWNDDDGSNPPTNIVRLREALKIGVEARKPSAPATDSNALAQGTRVATKQGEIEYVVYYDRGVGTGLWDRLYGGLSGGGLDDNIRQAYRFLCNHFRPNDEIHIFGFSRGAFTARSIVGYLFSTGLLKPEYCTTERENQAWRYYRTSPGDRNCGDWHALKPFLYEADDVRVTSLGVFDTVGALGIPSRALLKANRFRFAFHNTELSSIVENSFHAIAIDEHRTSFEATLWRTPKFKKFDKARVEQVWFPGAHADIGGGYTRWDEGFAGRQDIAFGWMLQRLIDCVGLDFAPLDAGAAAAAQRCDPQARLDSDIHRPWGRVDRFRSQACRAINQTKPIASEGSPVKGRGTVAVGLQPNEDPIGEMIHISALRLLDPTSAPPGRIAWEGLAGTYPYRPPNLVAVLPLIAFTYQGWDPEAWEKWKRSAEAISQMTKEPRTMSIVDWNGTIVPRTPPAQVASDDPRNVFTYLGSSPQNFGL